MWRLPIAKDPSGSAARRRTARSTDTLGTADQSSRTQHRQSSDTPSAVSSSSTYRTSRGARQATRQAATKPTDDIPVFDRNKVSLEFPGSLFGPSVSLLIRSTKLVGDVVQNSAVRYQSFLRLFRPLFRGPFEIKGLDPPTTTTTRRTTTVRVTSTTPAPAADNEIKRRR